MTRLGVLVPLPKRAPLPPEAQPLGRAALTLAREGLDVVFGAEVGADTLSGSVARPGGWERVAHVPVAGVFDRYPSRVDQEAHAALVAHFSVPVVNSLDRIRTCRDKIRTQEVLVAAGVRMPEIVTDPACFEDALRDWGRAFLKPRYGAMGRGICVVTPGDPLPAMGEGTIPGEVEPLFLQRAVVPPDGWAGISVRVLAQREGAGWTLNPGVARRSRTDPIVSASRGAELACIEDWLAPEQSRALADAVTEAACALQTPGLVEVGVDVMIDAEGMPWVIEVNSRPWGRVRGLAERDARFAKAHEAACMRPLRWLAEHVATP